MGQRARDGTRGERLTIDDRRRRKTGEVPLQPVHRFDDEMAVADERDVVVGMAKGAKRIGIGSRLLARLTLERAGKRVAVDEAALDDFPGWRRVVLSLDLAGDLEPDGEGTRPDGEGSREDGDIIVVVGIGIVAHDDADCANADGVGADTCDRLLQLRLTRHARDVLLPIQAQRRHGQRRQRIPVGDDVRVNLGMVGGA